MEKPKVNSKALRMFYFIAGIVATFCYRAIVVVNNYSHTWAQIFWYVGTIGFIIYFAHRYQISQKRAKLIKNYQLAEKVKNIKELSQDEKNALKYIFNSLKSSKENWNSIFIFVSSFIALILGFYLDFIKGI